MFRCARKHVISFQRSAHTECACVQACVHTSHAVHCITLQLYIYYTYMPWDIWDVCVRCMSGVFFFGICTMCLHSFWLVVWNIFPYIGNSNPKWRTHIFKMVKTTNQVCNDEFFWVSRGNGVALFLSSLGSGSRLVATSSQATFCWRNPPESERFWRGKFSKPCSGWLIVVFIGYNQQWEYDDIYWLVVWNMCKNIPFLVGMMIQSDELIFFRGVETTN